MISREEAIEILYLRRMTAAEILDSLPPKAREKSSMNGYIESLDMAIEALSTERPKGRWVRKTKHFGDCSECEENISRLCNFCPNCGAEMVRGEEE